MSAIKAQAPAGTVDEEAVVDRGLVNGGHRRRGSRSGVGDEPGDHQAGSYCQCHGKKHDDQRDPVGASPEE